MWQSETAPDCTRSAKPSRSTGDVAPWEKLGRMADEPANTEGAITVVAIGARTPTALASLRSVMKALPGGNSAAVVIVPPDLDHPGEAELLRNLGEWTGKPATLVASGIRPEAGRIYMAPACKALTMSAGRLTAAEAPARPGQSNGPLDLFLASLAAELHECAVCVVLDNGDLDGALGIASAKKSGGVTIAEQPKAELGAGRSRGEISAASIADFVLPAESIAGRLASYIAHIEEADTLPREAGSSAPGPRINGLSRINADGSRGPESTQIATLFLDSDLRIQSFTPAAADIFHVTEADVGRPAPAIPSRVAYPDLGDDVRHVLRTLSSVERELEAPAADMRYFVRVLPYPYRNRDSVTIGAVLTFLDIGATARAERALREAEERFRMMAEIVPAFMFTGCAAFGWDYANPHFYEYTGQSQQVALEDAWRASIHPDDIAEDERRWRHNERIGATTFENELRIRGASGEYRWFLSRATAQFDAKGRPERWYGSCVDIHERKVAETRQNLLLAELQHRVKNVLAVVRSVLSQTLENSTSLDEFAAHIEGRINALARTQAVLARIGQGKVDLEELVRNELAAQGGQEGDRVRITGPSVLLHEKAAEVLGLALHELTTNAVKYGALATPRGRIAVRWRVKGDREQPWLALEWQESGVPVTDIEPDHSGFGRELIEHGLPYDLGAKTGIEFLPGGVRCAIEVPLARP